MRLRKALENQLYEAFKCNTAVSELEKRIRRKARDVVNKKYKGTLIFKHNLRYEFGDVIARYCNRFNGLEVADTVSISLIYFCTSKIPKYKKDRIEECKGFIEKHQHVLWNNFKIPAWIELQYEVSIDRIEDGSIDLLID